MRIKLFYGWYIVIAGVVLSAYTGAIFAYGWTGFVNPILATFGWSMAQLSLASSLRGLETGVFNPIWGRAVDRWPPRKMMLFGVTIAALGVFCLSQTQNLVMYYAGFLIVGLGSSLYGQILPLTLISRWFKRDLGKASGLFAMGVGFGGVAVPLVVKVIDSIGWQSTLFYAAIGLLIIGLPAAFVYRSRPQDYGLLPDGKAPSTKQGLEQGRTSEFGISVGEAIRSRPFWYLGIVNLCHMLVMGALNLYLMPYLTDYGISRTTASTVVSLYTLVSLFMRLPYGILADIFQKKYVIALSVGLQCVGLFLFWLVGSTSPFWLVVLFGISFGLGLGGASALRAPILAEYFGTKNFGAIFGLSSLFMTVGMVVSPLLVGWIYDTYDDIRICWLGLFALSVLALVMILIIPKMRRGKEGDRGRIRKS